MYSVSWVDVLNQLCNLLWKTQAFDCVLGRSLCALNKLLQLITDNHTVGLTVICRIFDTRILRLTKISLTLSLHTEAEYAYNKRKHIILLNLEAGCEPVSWLERLYTDNYDFTDRSTVDQAMRKLLGKLNELGVKTSKTGLYVKLSTLPQYSLHIRRWSWWRQAFHDFLVIKAFYRTKPRGRLRKTSLGAINEIWKIGMSREDGQSQ